MSCAQGLSPGKTAGLTSSPRQHVRSHPPRSSQHTAPNFLQLVLQTATLLSPTLFGAGWTLSAKRPNSGVVCSHCPGVLGPSINNRRCAIS